MEAPLDRDALRAMLSVLAPREKKIVGGMLAVMLRSPERVSEREWVTEQFVHVALLAGGFDDVAAVQAYAREHVTDVLNASFLAFRCTADDLAARADLTLEEALFQAMTYFAPAADAEPTPAEGGG